MIKSLAKRRRLLHEILALVALCFAISLILYFAVTFLTRGLIESYCFNNDIVLEELELYQLENTLSSVGFVVSALFFVILFFALFGDRLSYIRTIIRGIHALQKGDYGKQVALVGNNELTQLAEAINYLSENEQRIKEKEKKLNQEKEELIRTLSHDIRTPLTSVMSYTELLTAKETLSEEEMHTYLSLVGKKTAQIKELTDILLDGGKRSPEYFEDAKLLFEQLASEFEAELEEHFKLAITLSSLSSFSGSFDTGEMRRVFDNLISNIQKYADPAVAVTLSISKTNDGIVIHQRNGITKPKTPAESHQMGLYSIRRIAQNYGGTTKVEETNSSFEITVTLSNF